MTPEQVLQTTPKVLSERQRVSYYEDGYLLVEKAIDDQWLARLRTATEKMVMSSREVTASDATWDIESGHSAAAPKLRRLSSPNDHHPDYWAYACSDPVLNIVADLIGPDIKFHHSKLNFKWAGGGEEVKWHQDIGFWPHTNFTPCTVGLYLEDCTDDQGPLGVIAQSHRGPLFDQYSDEGAWVGCLSDDDVEKLDLSREVYLPGPAGSITIHNCRTVHGSRKNQSKSPRPLLLNAYAAADAMPYTVNPARWARHDAGTCLISPDWSKGYTSIFLLQQEKENSTM